MGARKKDSACLNAYISKSVMDGLEAYCARTGRTKTIVTEWALAQYLREHEGEAGVGLDMDLNKEGYGDGEA